MQKICTDCLICVHLDFFCVISVPSFNTVYLSVHSYEQHRDQYSKQNCESRLLAGHAIQPEFELVMREDLLNEREPDPLTVFLRAEEWREEMRPNVLRDSAARIIDCHESSTSRFTHANGNRSLPVHRFHRILQNIKKYLLHLSLIHCHLL